MKSADLHLHTNFSDSTYAPSELVRQAKHAGLACIAVVDHDTVLGIKPVLEAAGKLEDLEVIPGIELSVEYEGLEVHILGYLIDYTDKNLNKQLSLLKKNRIERAHKMLKKLKGIGIDLKLKDIFAVAGKGTIGRLHIARAMVKKKVVSSPPEAFRKYIGDKCPAYVLDFKLSALKAIKLIKDAGGIPILAHPYVLNNDELIVKLIKYGLMGLEVYYPKHSPALVRHYLGLSRKYGLLMTGGSDCHGNADRIGSVKIPYDLVEKIKRAKDIN